MWERVLLEMATRSADKVFMLVDTDNNGEIDWGEFSQSFFRIISKRPAEAANAYDLPWRRQSEVDAGQFSDEENLLHKAEIEDSLEATLESYNLGEWGKSADDGIQKQLRLISHKLRDDRTWDDIQFLVSLTGKAFSGFNLNDDQKIDIVCHLDIKEFDEDENITVQGDVGEYFYIILTGSASVRVAED
eukprot:743692_1